MPATADGTQDSTSNYETSVTTNFQSFESNKENIPVRHDADESHRHGCLKDLAADRGRPTRAASPQTPVRNTITQAELTGNIAEAWNYQAGHLTPVDEVQWRTTPGSSAVQASQASQRGKKRPRSSSPPCSSQRARMDPEAVTRYLKEIRDSMKADSGALGLACSRGDDALPPKLQFQSSSPHAPASNEKCGAQRSASYGVGGADTLIKRRKLSSTKMLAGTSARLGRSKHLILAKDRTHSVRVEQLLRDFEENRRPEPTSQPDGPSSSSPLPDKTGLHAEPPISPLQNQQRRQHQLARECSETPCADTIQVPEQNPSDDFSDIEDDDLDFDDELSDAVMLQMAESMESPGDTGPAYEADNRQGSIDNVEINVQSCLQEDHNFDRIGRHADADFKLSQHATRLSLSQLPSLHTAPTDLAPEDDSDEFDDLGDDDIFSQLAAEMDQKTMRGATANGIQGSTIHSEHVIRTTEIHHSQRTGPSDRRKATQDATHRYGFDGSSENTGDGKRDRQQDQRVHAHQRAPTGSKSQVRVC